MFSSGKTENHCKNLVGTILPYAQIPEVVIINIFNVARRGTAFIKYKYIVKIGYLNFE